MGGPPAEKTIYITTPIYYVNDVPHLGHAYTTLAADVLARHHRLRGREVFFLTGTDEHGQKVERSAAEQGLKPIELADRTVERFKAVWEALHISNDDFIRTTEPRHRRAVEEIFRRINEAGDIYMGEYEGLYCVPCETFWTDLQVGEEGGCPSCGRALERLREKSYFFRMSSYEKRLLEHIDTHPEFIQPESRRNEVLSFVRQGLKDLSISRTTFDWGLPVPTDPSHVLYVWFDALTNYLTAPGFGDDPERFERIWPADIHLIGKDILRFHAVYWPTFLMAAGLPLPRTVYGHGWWTVEGRKMSKSLRNVVDPLWLIDTYGVDAVRYFLLREVPFGADGDFSHAAFIRRLNAELANDLGNLLSRTVAMIQKYCDGIVPKSLNTSASVYKTVWSRGRSASRLASLKGAVSSMYLLTAPTSPKMLIRAFWKAHSAMKPSWAAITSSARSRRASSSPVSPEGSGTMPSQYFWLIETGRDRRLPRRRC